MEDRIRALLDRSGKIKLASSLSKKENLFEAGMDSFGCVQLMLNIEEEFDIEFPDHLLIRSSFETIAAIQSSIETLQA